MKKKRKINAIFFDVGQTLVEELSAIAYSMELSLRKHLSSQKEDFQHMAYEWGYKTHDIFMTLREQDDFKNARDINRLALTTILQKKGISITAINEKIIVEDVWKTFVENNKIYPDTIPTLQQLKQTGRVIGIITDCDIDVVEGIMQKHGLSSFFDVTVISEEMKAYKPKKIMFTKALNKANCTASQAVYVGDSEIDIKGAKKVGMITVIVKRKGVDLGSSGGKPDYTINSLTDLPPLLSPLEGNHHVINSV